MTTATTIENNELADIISSLNLGLFSEKSSDAKYNAQQNLAGRNYFATEETLRYFGSRISRARPSCSGLLFYVIESSYLNMEKSKRGFRYAIFDIFGNEVGRQKLDEALSTSDKAMQAMYDYLGKFDVLAHYKQALQSEIRQAERKAERTKSALEKMEG